MTPAKVITDGERLRLAQLEAREALEKLFWARMKTLPDSSKDHARMRWRWMNPGKVVRRLIDITLADRLDLSGL